MIPVILSGGSGTRLWPVSRQALPKQFCHLFEESLQGMTLKRCAPLGKPWIVTGAVVKEQTELNMKQAQVEANVIYEPFGKNTAPAIATLCQVLSSHGQGEESVAVFPSDHLVRKEDLFRRLMTFAGEVAQTKKVVTIGITPTYPETGYGYIQTNETPLLANGEVTAFSVLKFHEKPSFETAVSFIQQNSFSWNAGIFVFRVDFMIELFKKHQPEMWSVVSRLKKDLSNLSEIYNDVQSISIDYAIMERLDQNELACIPAELGWSDVGSWDAMSQLKASQDKIEVSAKNNFVFGLEGKSYSFIGVDDVIVVNTADALMIVKKGSSQDVRKVVDLVNAQQPHLVAEPARRVKL